MAQANDPVDWRRLVDNSNEAVFHFDAAGVIVYANKSAAALLGYAPGELVGLGLRDIHLEEELERARRQFAERMNGKAGLSEYRLRRKDGGQAWVSASSIPVRDAAGACLGLIGFARDIAEAKRNEALRAHELRLLRRIAGDAPLTEVLDDLCLTLESLASRRLRCAVMIADLEQDTLSCLAAPSMHQAFRSRAAYAIRDGSSACAQALHAGQPVIIADALNDGAAEPVLALRRDFGYAAVWSHPIVQDGLALGTLAFLPEATGTPKARDAHLIDFGIEVARLALAHARDARALRRSEQRFRDYAELSADWYWEQDAALRFTALTYGPNSRSGRVHQYDRELIGKRRWDLPYVNVPEGFWEDHRRRLEAGEAFADLRLQRQTENGIVHVEISGRPLFDAAGRLAGYRGIGRDVTARVRAEQALNETTNSLKLALSAAHIGMWERDIDTWVFHFSDSWKALFGYAADEIADGKAQFDRLVHPDDLERAHAAALAYIANPIGEYKNEFRVRHKNGAWRWVLARGNVIADPVSGKRRWLGCHLDITESRQAQEALAESEARFRDFVDMAADWHWEQDAEFRFTALSGGILNKGNFRIADALGRTRWELDREGLNEAVWPAHRACLARHEPFHEFVYRIRADDGALHDYCISGRPVFGPDGRFLGYRGTARDITTQLRAERRIRELNATLEDHVKARTAELENANRELDAFNYSVSHDLRAPLRSVHGFSQALLEDYAARLDADGRDLLERICAAAKRMGGLIDAMYHLSRLSHSLLQIRPCDLSEKAEAVVAELRQADPARQIEVAIAPGLRAEGDPALLRVLLGNLLGNAWKYSARAPRARIEFLQETDADGQAVFVVRDNGAGFDMQFADKLFRLFQRLHRDEDFGGQGVGLVTAQRIVGRHGGRIWGQGEKGRGAEFRFTLWDDPALRREAKSALEKQE